MEIKPTTLANLLFDRLSRYMSNFLAANARQRGSARFRSAIEASAQRLSDHRDLSGNETPISTKLKAELTDPVELSRGP